MSAPVRNALCAAAVMAGVVLLCGADAPLASGGAASAVDVSRAVWREAKWPFLMDQWGLGRAFECPASACGRRVRFYLRAKLGFCDCNRGVADDDEVDRVADIELISPTYTAATAGHLITVGPMRGRSRRYDVVTPALRQPVLAITYSANCSVVVATIEGGGALPDMAEQAALEFLNSQPVLRWASDQLGS